MSFYTTAWIVVLTSLCMSLTTLASASLIQKAVQGAFVSEGIDEIHLSAHPKTNAQHRQQIEHQVLIDTH